jgi:hypothetical protein
VAAQEKVLAQAGAIVREGLLSRGSGFVILRLFSADFDELSQIVRGDAERVQDANVRQLAAIEQPVHGCGAHAELSRDLADAEEERCGSRASW